LDFDERVQQVNPKASELLGCTADKLLGRSLLEIDKPLMQEIRALSSGEGKTISLDGVHTYKLQRSHFIDRGFARSFVMIEELTADILAAEKNAYGKVIRMMAHEVNNTIGPVNSILDSAIQTGAIWTEEHQSLKHALTIAFERNQGLNMFMRNFADVVRLPLPNKTEIDLSLLVARVAGLFEFKARDAGIRMVIEQPAQAFQLHADTQQMEQALINIVKNAMEAIEGGGKISIAITPMTRTLTVKDTGAGIRDEHSSQLFTPFFSTKKDGQGVGLTLVREILMNHGFTFSLKSGTPSGAVFKIEFGA
ncbi:MAG TPA: ATP-binding protein, partial [Flavisolibacter sp.]|nr:ATP-binding protein [Flavisolibacter sp.]